MSSLWEYHTHKKNIKNTTERNYRKNHDSLQIKNLKNKTLILSKDSLKQNLSSRERMSLFIAASSNLKGSLSIEAAFVLPIYLLCLMLFFSFFSALHVQSRYQTVLEQEARQAAVLIYDTDNRDAALIKGLILAGINKECPDSYLKNHGIENWLSGILLSEMKIPDDKLGIWIRTKLAIKPITFPVQHKKIGLAMETYARTWTGFSGLDGNASNENTTGYYKTPHGTVYHKDLQCSYLNPTIQEVETGQLTTLRNRDGEKYKECESCAACNGSGCYITDYGNRYHKSLSCSGLKRTIYMIGETEIGECRPCSKCAK